MCIRDRLYTDWSGSQIGCGNGNKVYNDGGNVYISGGSIKTVITENACQFFDITPAQNTVSDAAITANKLNNDTDNEAVYQLIFDTSVLSSPAESFTVKAVSYTHLDVYKRQSYIFALWQPEEVSTAQKINLTIWLQYIENGFAITNSTRLAT